MGKNIINHIKYNYFKLIINLLLYIIIKLNINIYK